MHADIIQAEYDQLNQIAQRFLSNSERVLETEKNIGDHFDDLQDKGWEGQGAEAFFHEMQDEVFPALSRLRQALADAQSATLRIREILLQADQDASALFQNIEGGAEIVAASIGSGSNTGGFWGGFKDFFHGMYDEGKDMVLGLYNLVTDPVGTAKGLWHAITHPKELWAAFKEPYVEAWEDGRPFYAIGRGVMFVGSLLLGTKGADKASKLAKTSRAARTVQEATEFGARFSNITDDVARAMSSTAQGSRAETAAARFVANQSTQNFIGRLADRVVLGGFRANPLTGFRGYINEARDLGGRVFNTSSDVWDILKPVSEGGNGRIWSVNREFLQTQMETGMNRIQLMGESISDVLNNPARARSYTGQEIRYLQQNAYQYGYRLDGDTWVQTGDWRASTAGRAGGASAGPALDLFSTAEELENR